MTRSIIALFAAALVFVVPGHANSPERTSNTVKVTARMAKAMGLVTTTLRSRTWRPSWIAYGQVVSTAELMNAARRVTDAQQTLTAARVAAAASSAEYRRLQGLFAHHANVSLRQLENARARRQSDRAVMYKAEANLAAVRSTVDSEWGAVISGWLTMGTPRLSRFAAGKARLVRLTLPGRSQVADPEAPVDLVTIDGVRIPSTWVSAAPTSGKGMEGAAFYVLAKQGVAQLAYGSGVTGHIPHGQATQGVVVPRSAVVWSGSAAWIFVRSDKDTFLRMPVSTLQPTVDGWFETNIPASNTEVVVRGAQVLLSIEQQAVSPPAPAGDDDD